LIVACSLLALSVAIPTADQPSWLAGSNEFDNWQVEDLKKLCGTILEPIPEHMIDNTAVDVASIPDSFDARDQWGSCIHPIRNQQKCGSCWAFGASEAFSDRLCIASKNKTNVVLSPEDLVSCDKYGNMGCNGGVPHLAWDYMELAGLPTDACFPYTAGGGDAPACTNKCKDSETWTAYKVKKFSTKGYKSVASIQNAIMTDGPVEAAFSVYEDFMKYSSGVYEHTTGSLLGGHAIKVIGWGTESGKPYWTVANSWGTTWGEQGFFKILRGKNECGIEQGVVAGQAETTADVEGDSRICTDCKKVADAVVSKLINLVFQGTVVGGCGDLCGHLDKPAEQKVCDGLCVLSGEVAFEDLIKKAQLNPENLCYDIKVCKH